MGRLRNAAWALSVVLMTAGCSSKSLFEPQDISGKVSFDHKLPAPMAKVYRDGALLENRQVVTPDGLSQATLPAGYDYLSETNGTIVSSNGQGDILLIDAATKKERHIAGDEPLVAAKYDSSGLIAGMTRDNTAVILDIDANKTVFRQKGGKAIAIDRRVANPVFLSDLAIIPTLDGKLLIVDKHSGKLIRDMALSNEEFFNNVIFLDVIGNRLIAATGSKVMSITPRTMNTINQDIRDVLFVHDGVYILTKDGQVILTDADLKVIKSRKFQFAHFVGGIHGKYIYALEKEGYVIALNAQLTSSNTFKTDTDFDGPVFASKDKIFAGDKIFELSKD